MLLMHGNIPVAKVKMQDGKVFEYDTILKEDELPLGTKGNGKQQEQILLNHWIKSRSIPRSRPNLHTIEEKIGIDKTNMFMQTAGISITDTYWFKEEDSSILWEDINFHDNGFDPIFAKLYLNGEIITNNMFSPDFTTDGIMEKFWYQSNGIPYLAKIDTQYENVLSANEIVYYQIANTMEIDTTPYFSGQGKLKQFCSCPCFIENSSEDYISCMQLKHSNFALGGENLYNYLIKKLGFEKQIKEMISLDIFFHQKDRHERNMGVKKDKNGLLTFINPFDNGFCLGADKSSKGIITDNDMKLFNGSRKEILDKYGIPLNIDKRTCLDILQTTYEQFNIPEYKFEIAKEELEFGMDLFKDLNRTKYIAKEIIFNKSYNPSNDINKDLSNDINIEKH